MFSSTFRKTLASLLVATNLCSPIAALAGAYDYRASVRDLRVTGVDGGTSGDGGTLLKAVLTPDTANYAFGSIVVGAVSPVKTITFTNTGLLPAFTGTAYVSAGYQQVSNCDSLALSPGETCTVAVQFAPTQVQNFAPGTVTVPFTYPGAIDTPVGIANFTAIGAPVPVAVAPNLTLSSNNLQLGSVLLGQVGTQSTTLSNTGNQIATLQYSSLAAGFTRGGDCGATLAIGSSCTLSLSYAPTQEGSASTTLLVTANGGASYASVSAQAQGVPAFQLSLSTNSLEFTSGTQRSVVITNTGQSALQNPVISVSGASFSASHNCSVLAPAQSCTAVVTRAVNTPGSFSGTLSVGFDSVSASSVSLSSVVSGSLLTLTPASIDLGSVSVGQSSAVSSVTLSNQGNAAAELLISAPTHASVARTGTCSATLAAGASCTLDIQYTPESNENIQGVVTVEDTNAAVQVRGSAVLNYAAVGVGTEGMSLAVAGGNLLGDTLLGGTVSRTVTLLNTGNLSATGVSLTATGNAAITLSGQCPATLAAGQSCQVSVVFAPTAMGLASSTLTATSASGLTQSLVVSATGRAIVLDADQVTQAFGSVNIGSTSSKTTTITNNGNLSAILSYNAVVAPFSRSGTCSTTLAAGASCTVVLTYAPTAASSSTGSVTVSATGSSATVSFSGTGQGNPSFSLSSSTHAFGNVAAGQTATQAVTVTNTGNVPLATPSVTASGAGFTASTTCASSLAVGATCTITATFAPTAGQAYNGSVSVGYTGVASQTLTLSGTGQASALSVDAATQAFGNVDIGTSVTRTFTLTNYGNISGALAVESVAAPFTRGGTCSGSLAAGASCTVTLTFTPVDTTPWSRTLDMTLGGLTSTLSYSGTGVALPAMTISTYSLTLGGVATGATTTASVTVYNAGNVSLSTPAISSTGAAFSVAHNCPATLAAGASCTATTTFAPTAAQNYSGTLSVGYAGVATQTVTLSGTGQAAVLGADITTQAFGTVAIGGTSSKTSTITNTGNIAATLNFSAVTAPFSRSGTCSTTLAAAASCTLVLTYAPTDTSLSTGSVTVSATSTSTTVSFSGTGQANPSFGVSSLTQAFGDVAVGQAPVQTISVTNTGNVVLNTPAINTTGAGFSATHNCPATLAVGTSCQVNTTFTPTAPQAYSGSLAVGFAGVTTQAITLTGTGQAAVLSTNTFTQDFGSVNVGSNLAKSYTITNSGNIAAALSYTGVSAPFVRSGTCSTTLAANSSCTVVLTYTPTDASTTSGSVLVSAPGTSVTLNYTGTGVVITSFALSSNIVAFGSVTVGSTSTLPLTVTNNGGTTLTLSSIVIAGGGLSQLNTCGATLASGASCTVSITVAPVAAQAYSGSVTVTYSGLAAKSASITATGSATTVTWQSSNTLPTTAGSWWSVAGSPTRAVVVSRGTLDAMYTLDGTTWTKTSMPSNQLWVGVTYGNGAFVAVANGPSTATARSTDGITWTANTLPASRAWNSIAYGNGTFIAQDSGKNIAKSVDGITWTTGGLNTLSNAAQIYFLNDRFISVSGGTTAYSYSTDGTTWTAGVFPSTFTASGTVQMAYGNGTYVATIANTAGTVSAYAYSTDGVTWTSGTLPSAGCWYIGFVGGKFVITASGTASFMSTDGINWTATSSPTGITWTAQRSVTQAFGRLIQIGAGATKAIFTL